VSDRIQSSADSVKERRLRCYPLSWTDLLRLASKIEATPAFVSFPKIELPDDAVVVGCYNNPLYGTFDFQVASSEFDPVDPAFELPRVRPKVEVVLMRKEEQ
jgi:hypothetical protein